MPRSGGGLVVWARFPEATMVPGGVFGLDALEDEDGDEVIDLGAPEEEIGAEEEDALRF